MRGVFTPQKRKGRRIGASIYKAMRGSRILYISICFKRVLQALLSAFPPRPRRQHHETLNCRDTWGSLLPLSIIRLDKKREKKNNNNFKKHCTSSAEDFETKYLIYLWSTCSSTCPSFIFSYFIIWSFWFVSLIYVPSEHVACGCAARRSSDLFVKRKANGLTSSGVSSRASSGFFFFWGGGGFKSLRH